MDCGERMGESRAVGPVPPTERRDEWRHHMRILRTAAAIALGLGIAIGWSEQAAD
jgi:hypothetical protein